MKDPIYLCIDGCTLNTPSPETNKVIIKDYPQVKSILEDDIYKDEKVIIVGAGNTSCDAADLALKHEKECLLNGESFTFISNSKSKLTDLQALLVLTSQSIQEEFFKDVSRKLIAEASIKCPSFYSPKAMKDILSKSAPLLTLSSGETAQDFLLSGFESRLNIRRKENKSRLSVEIDNENIIEVNMDYDDALPYILANPALYVISWEMGEGKTEKVVKPAFNTLFKSIKKVLLMTSTVALTDALCSDDRNYKKALEDGVLKEQNALASCLYSALLSPAFKSFREATDVAIFEEYESCRDALTADIVGKGTLAEKVKAQEAFNELLKKETVIISDAHFSQQSADHIIARTNRKIIVIKPLIEPKKQPKKINYYLDSNTAIKNTRDTLDSKKRALTFADRGHDGGGSKFEEIGIQITDGFDIKSKTIDASFFKKKENFKHMQNPTEFANQYDHLLSTSVWRNGISMHSNFDLVTMLCYQTISPLDVIQWSDRDRPNLLKSLFISKNSPYNSLNYISIFEEELKKGILAVDVAETRELLKFKDATKDIVNRILYNNEMRSDYANNLLTMFEILGYEISYDYSETDDETKENNEKAISKERQDRLDIYVMVDVLKHMSKIKQINSKEESARTLDEKRVSYAADVYTYYNIDNKSEDLEDVFDFDCNGRGRKILRNFSLATDGYESDYYLSYAREYILQKFFKCLNLDKNLKGTFVPDDCREFHKFIHNESLDIHGNSERIVYIIRTLFKGINTKDPARLCTSLLKRAFGLIAVFAKRKSTGKKETLVKYKEYNKEGNREYVKCISNSSAERLLRFYRMANPFLNITTEKEVLEHDDFIDRFDLLASNLVIQDFEAEESDNDCKGEPDYDFYVNSISEAIKIFDELPQG